LFPNAGKPGDLVLLLGVIGTVDGSYEVWFGDTIVASNSAVGIDVRVNFTVPELPGGDYLVSLKDVNQNINASQPFPLYTGYYIEALVPSPPEQLQEGSDVTLNVTVTGAFTGFAYQANITVELPAPLNTNYSRVIELTGSPQTGTLHADVNYPAPGLFQPSGSTTAFTGLYNVYFNMTEFIAEDQFFIGFTDANEYHRGQSVKIRAIGYQANENSTITITHNQTGTTFHSESITASSEGIIDTTWIVPNNALIGTYNITITPKTTLKAIIDSQLFTIRGYPIRIRTLNLAGEPVPSIFIEALDQTANTVYNGTSGADGIASVKLEAGNQTISAYWNNVKVGEMNVLVSGESAYDLECKLTNLRITVQDKNGFVIPFVNLNIAYEYVTTKGNELKTGSTSGQTDLLGTFSLNSTLPEISYFINASIYDVVFNTANNTTPSLPVQPIFEATIICPSQTLTLRILDYNLEAISNARTELVEITSGIFQGVMTDTAGTSTLDITLGKYRIRVYADEIMLNETIIEVFEKTQREIRCSLYNIQISVAVVDYFEQPIPNANVTLHGPGIGTRSAITKADGLTTFSNVIGGNMQIIAYASGIENTYEALNLQIQEPIAITIKMAKYILIGPLLIETSLLTTLIIILSAIILFIAAEVYRRKRIKPVNSKS
jgi:hypothetical protein